MYKGLKKLMLASARILAMTVFVCLAAGNLFAQDAGYVERPKDVKVVREYKDGKGHIIRELQYKQGAMIVTETVILPEPKKVHSAMAINPDTLNKDSLVIYIDKSHYILMVFYKHKLIRKFRAVFGPNPQQNKQMQGDRNTPEGWFTITRLNPRSKYNKFMELSYPDAQHRENFRRLKERGIIPKSAKIGGNVGIHGIWQGGDDMIELGVGWTDGCIALCNRDIDELYRIAGLGTKVFIKK